MTICKMMLRNGLAAVGLMALAMTGSALAQQATSSTFSGLSLSGDQPIQIESDRLEVVDPESKAIFTGNVNVTQGATLMKAGKMTVFYAKAGGDQKAAAPASATGSSNIDKLEVDDKVYIKTDNQVATGDRGVFDMKTQVLVLSGQQVVLSQGVNVLVGCKLTANMKNGRAQVEGCDGGRVKMLITPGTQNQ